MLQLRAFRHPSLPENFVVFDLPVQLLYEIVWSFLTFAVDFRGSTLKSSVYQIVVRRASRPYAYDGWLSLCLPCKLMVN
jgi:hypothetical protein